MLFWLCELRSIMKGNVVCKYGNVFSKKQLNEFMAQS